MNYVLITDNNIEDFRVVLPVTELPSANRYTFGAYSDDLEIAGAISFFFSNQGYIIDWLYVTPSMRRRGVATELLGEILSFIEETGEIYPVSATYEVSDQNLELYGFFLSIESMVTAYSHMRYYVRPSEIASAAELKKSARIDAKDQGFFELSNDDKNRFLSELKGEYDYVVTDFQAWREACIPELCRVVHRDEKLLGAIFVMGRSDGNLELSYLYGTSAVAIKNLLTAVAEEICKNYGSSKLIFDITSENALSIAKKLFPDAETVHIYETTW